MKSSRSHYLIDQIQNTENIEVKVRHEVVEAHGEDRLESVSVCNLETNEVEKISAPAMFIFIGAVPHTEMVRSVVHCNSAGFILTGKSLVAKNDKPSGWRLKRDPYLLETSVPGIFAAGDVRQGAVRRVATAVGEGAVAVSLVHQYLQTV